MMAAVDECVEMLSLLREALKQHYDEDYQREQGRLTKLAKHNKAKRKLRRKERR